MDRTVCAVVAGAFFATSTIAGAQPYDCLQPEESCGAEVAPVCLQRVGAGAIRAETEPPHTGRDASCSTQLLRYRQCLAWIVENCDADRGGELDGATPEDSADAVRQHCFIWDNKKMCEPY